MQLFISGLFNEVPMRKETYFRRIEITIWSIKASGVKLVSPENLITTARLKNQE